MITISFYANTTSGYKYVGWEKFEPIQFLKYRSWMKSGNAVKVNRTIGKRKICRFYPPTAISTFRHNEF